MKSTETVRHHSQKIRQKWGLQKEEKALLDLKKSGQEPKSMGGSGPFPCGSEKAEVPIAQQGPVTPLIFSSACFCLQLGPVPPHSDEDLKATD